MTTDMSAVIVPKSDQINADDFLSGPKTFRISGKPVISPGADQPVTIPLEGSKPWRPCKSMSRLLVAAWGPDASQYVGRILTLYCDPKVKWGGMEVGGIRVSHMSHIDSDLVVALTQTKGKKAPTRVKPLKAETVALKVVEKPVNSDSSKNDYGPTKTITAPDAPGFDFPEFEGIVTLAIANMGSDFPTWWEEQKPLRLQARDADKARAGEIATRANEFIESLKEAY